MSYDRAKTIKIGVFCAQMIDFCRPSHIYSTQWPLYIRVLVCDKQWLVFDPLQSLLLIFIFLIQSSHLEEVISFLSGIPDISGNSSLQSVLTQWCHAHPYFLGQYETKLRWSQLTPWGHVLHIIHNSMLAMCQLLLYCVTNGNSQLCSIMVEGEEVRSHDLGAGILTRSKKSKGTIIPSGI